MIFNSLGSNYDFGFVLNSLFALSKNEYNSNLVSFLNNKYDGKTILLYKCREAIKLALRLLDLPKGSKAGINGFTCYVVYKAIKDAGYETEYIDIEKDSLNFTFGTVRKHKDLKVLIVQNTLGSPCDIEKISEYCKHNNIFLIEDLAHSVGTIHKSGKETGSFGDFAVLSFSQDKIIDAVSGGALVIRNKKYQKFLNKLKYKNLNFEIQFKDRFYPLFTYLIRNLYDLGIGKILHFILNKFQLLSQPVSDKKDIELHKLSSWYSRLAHEKFLELEENLIHRQKIAKIYMENIHKSVQIEDVVKNLEKSSNLRFPILTDNRNELIKYLKKYKIYVSDIWYDAPIAPSKFIKLTNYSGECRVSENISSKILNLPTHINVSEEKAKYISLKINKWLNTK